MTDKSAAAGPVGDGPAAGDSTPRRDEQAGEERVIIRNNRKINVDSTKSEADEATGGAAEMAGEPDVTNAADVVEGEVVEQPVDAAQPETAQPEAGAKQAEQPAPGPLGAELAALRSDLDERTRDLQRLSAEYANYRKRVERDRTLAAEQATGNVLTALLPVLDDLDRAREHGDLVGPFGTVAEQLSAALAKFGLTPVGEKGDAFNPTLHEAVAHQLSADVTEPTCVEVHRRGYLLGERLLRPAMVAVADPE